MAEGSSPPDWLEGAWRREGLATDGGPLVERSDVLWLQVGWFFADLRAPRRAGDPEAGHLDVAQAFSGRIDYQSPRVTWFHDLDTTARPAGHADTATVACRDGVLLERGDGYLERWRRTVGGMPAMVIQRETPGTGATSARIVQVGDHALAVWDDPAAAGAAMERRGDRWSVNTTVGVEPSPAVTSMMEMVLREAEGRTRCLPDGWQVVTERVEGATN
jgi:hypothetical protein